MEKAGAVRDGGSFYERMGKVACWNSVMDEDRYMVTQLERVHRGLSAAAIDARPGRRRPGGSAARSMHPGKRRPPGSRSARARLLLRPRRSRVILGFFLRASRS